MDDDIGQIGGHRENCLRVGLFFYSHSPVDLCMIDPDGLVVNKEVLEIAGAIYAEDDLDNDGDLDDWIGIPEPKMGTYQIMVLPEPDALPEETYTLEVGDGETFTVLAGNIPISKIPEQPYLIQCSPEGIKITPILQALDNLVSISCGLVGYDRRTGQFSVDVKVTNNSQRIIGSPVWLVIESISNPAVIVANADGTTPDGNPYIDLSGLLGNGQLDPAESISKRIYFNNPNRLRFTFEPSVRGVIVP